MRIALVSDTYVPAVNGVATHVNLLKKGLQKLGHEVLVVCALSTAKKHFIKNGVLYCPGLNFKKIYNSVVAGPISHSRYKYIKDFDPDVIHIHTEFGVGYSGASAAKFLKVPLIYTMHTMYDNYIYYVAPKKLTNIVKKTSHVYAKILAQKSTCITGPSKKVEEFFRGCGVEKPIYVISNPVELEVFNFENFDENEKLMVRKKLNVEPGEFLVCFCGRLGREKSVNVLLNMWSESVKKTDGYRLVILGGGPCMNELKALCERLKIKDQVVFTGEIPHNQLAPYYCACDIYVTTSLSDTNSISMLEAMASGLPVCHLFDELNSDQIENGVNGFFFKNSDEMKKLFDRYKNMTTDEKLEIKKQVRKSVLRFGDVALAERLLEIYKKALQIYSDESNEQKLSSKFYFKLKSIGKRG